MPNMKLVSLLLALGSAGASTCYHANLSPIGGDGSVEGVVDLCIEGDGDIAGSFTNYAGLEPDQNNKDCTAANCMGIHVHAGTACTDADSQGGHYYNVTSMPDSDPWAPSVKDTLLSSCVILYY